MSCSELVAGRRRDHRGATAEYHIDHGSMFVDRHISIQPQLLLRSLAQDFHPRYRFFTTFLILPPSIYINCHNGFDFI